MRTHVSVRLALLFLAIAAPALVRAQFQPPTDEELKMTSDPKAPGAAAVYLYREETTDDHMHFHSYYERIKVSSLPSIFPTSMAASKLLTSRAAPSTPTEPSSLSPPVQVT
jgi:hypothetical protein